MCACNREIHVSKEDGVKKKKKRMTDFSAWSAYKKSAYKDPWWMDGR